jgi:hypothetical protein
MGETVTVISPTVTGIYRWRRSLSIAEDEARHAVLSFRIVAWALRVDRANVVATCWPPNKSGLGAAPWGTGSSAAQRCRKCQ